MKTKNTSRPHKIISSALVLLSFASLALLYLSAKPPGIAGVALTDLLNSGSVVQVQAFLSRAELHNQVLPYAQMGLPVVLIVMALLSMFSFRLSATGDSK